MNGRTAFFLAMICLAAVLLTTQCTVVPDGVNPGAAPTAQPTLAPAETPTTSPTAEPASTAQPTAAPLPPGPAGTWRLIGTADGLCSDWPVLIGREHIGTQGAANTFCYRNWSDPARPEWPTMTVPIGTHVTGALHFPPGGGMVVVTDDGRCIDPGWNPPGPGGERAWECQTVAQGFPYRDIRGLANLSAEPVYRLADAVAVGDHVYRLADLTGAPGAAPTWVAVSQATELSGDPEIWIGTNGYGVVVLHPRTGAARRFTTADGLPGNTIRDVNTGAEYLKGGSAPAVWVATDRGVALWNGVQWTAHTTAQGLPSDDVRGIAARYGVTEVWAATAAGPAYFDGSAWHAVETGLAHAEVNGVEVWEDEVWFTTRGTGLLVFTPAP